MKNYFIPGRSQWKNKLDSTLDQHKHFWSIWEQPGDIAKHNARMACGDYFIFYPAVYVSKPCDYKPGFSQRHPKEVRL